MRNDHVRISKFLSLVLRHQPEAAGLTLDAEGWVAVDDLIAACGRHGHVFTRAVLDEVVRTNDKQRFAFSADGRRIRASQGHSVAVNLGLEPLTPPPRLFHGTVARFLDSIRRTGIRRGARQYVHLSVDTATAERVGIRRGEPIVIEIDAAGMHRDGHVFFRSANGVWLTEHVPPSYIALPRQRLVLARGRFIQVVSQDGWEWVERVNTSGAVVIVALTARRELVLVEQFRIPLGRRVIELPAGLAGDLAGAEDEPMTEAARRELLEETGFSAERLEFLTEGPSSAGLATEVYAMYLARDAQRTGAGGGDATEQITVHVVPVDEAHAWLTSRRAEGLMVDPKVYAGLYFALH
jgi:putative RNA 2'-phosphotransferase